MESSRKSTDKENFVQLVPAGTYMASRHPPHSLQQPRGDDPGSANRVHGFVGGQGSYPNGESAGCVLLGLVRSPAY